MPQSDDLIQKAQEKQQKSEEVFFAFSNSESNLILVVGLVIQHMMKMRTQVTRSRSGYERSAATGYFGVGVKE